MYRNRAQRRENERQEAGEQRQIAVGTAYRLRIERRGLLKLLVATPVLGAATLLAACGGEEEEEEEEDD